MPIQPSPKINSWLSPGVGARLTTIVYSDVQLELDLNIYQVVKLKTW